MKWKAFPIFPISRRMGFVPIPITIMLIRVVGQSVNFNDRTTLAALTTIWLTLLFIKIFNGVLMHSKSVEEVLLYKSLQMAANDEIDEYEDVGGKRRFYSISVPGSRRISLYDFTDVLTQAAKKAPAPIIKLRRNSSIRDSIDVEDKTQIDEQTPPRRSQSMGNFIRQNQEDDLDSEKEYQTDHITRCSHVEDLLNDQTNTHHPKKMIVPALQEELANIQAYSLLGDICQKTIGTSTSDLPPDEDLIS